MPKTKTTTEFDLAGFETAKKTADQLVTDYAALRANQKMCEDAFFMDWQDKPSGNVKVTISPDPHNKVRGATRLLTATAPTFNVPSEKNNPDATAKSSLCEKAANAMWIGSNAVQGIVAERDAAHSGTLYGEMHLRIISTKDMLEAAKTALKDNQDESRKLLLEANVKHFEWIRRRTPYLFEPLDAMTCYARRSRSGLEAHYQMLEMTVADVIAAYGNASKTTKKPYEIVEVNIFYDRVNIYVWITGENDPILAGPHGLSFIPVACYSPEGSSTYAKMERKVLPFLYAVIKSGVWQRQSMFLTVTATNAYALMNAQFVHEKSTPDDVININHSTIGGIVEVPAGNRLTPLAKDIVNPGLVGQYQMYDGLMDESTIFDQTLGQPISGNATFSATALLHQAGRLPLTPIQEGMAALFANAMSIAFEWLKKDGAAKLSTQTGDSIEIEPKQIPEVLNFDVVVDVDLPQDKMQQASVGESIVGSGLASKEWVRGNILNIGQSDSEQTKIWREQMADAAAAAIFPQFIQMLTQKMGLPPVGPDGQPLPQGQPGQPIPEGAGQPEQPIQPVQPIPSGMTPGGQ